MAFLKERQIWVEPPYDWESDTDDSPRLSFDSLVLTLGKGKIEMSVVGSVVKMIASIIALFATLIAAFSLI